MSVCLIFCSFLSENLKLIAEYFQRSETFGGPSRDWIGVYEECATYVISIFWLLANICWCFMELLVCNAFEFELCWKNSSETCFILFLHIMWDLMLWIILSLQWLQDFVSRNWLYKWREECWQVSQRLSEYKVGSSTCMFLPTELQDEP